MSSTLPSRWDGWPPQHLHLHPTPCYPDGLEPGGIHDGYLRFWLPILGPTATIAYRTLLDAAPIDPATVSLPDLASDIGLGRATTRTRDALRRLASFGFLIPSKAQADAAILPTTVRPLEPRHLNRLRPALARDEARHSRSLPPTTLTAVAAPTSATVVRPARRSGPVRGGPAR